MVDSRSLEQFMQTVRRIHALLESRGVFDASGVVTPLQLDALLYLRGHSKPTAGSLGKYLQLSSSAVSQLINRLAKSGFIKREDSWQDRRAVLLSITPKGDRIFAKMYKTHLEKTKQLVSLVPEEDVKELIRIYSNFLQKIESQGGNKINKN